MHQPNRRKVMISSKNIYIQPRKENRLQVFTPLHYKHRRITLVGKRGNGVRSFSKGVECLKWMDVWMAGWLEKHEGVTGCLQAGWSRRMEITHNKKAKEIGGGGRVADIYIISLFFFHWFPPRYYCCLSTCLFTTVCKPASRSCNSWVPGRENREEVVSECEGVRMEGRGTRHQSLSHPA